MNFLVTIAQLVAFSSVASASDKWMNDAEMRNAFAGRTLTGAYASGMSFTESYTPDGSIKYVDPRGEATGRWHISQQGFCTFYDTQSMSGGCFLARQTSANCFEFYVVAGQDTGPLPEGSEKPYVAQGWYPEKPTTCQALTT